MAQAAPPVGVVVVPLGTPAAPTPAAVRAFLREMLTDRWVVDLPPLLWQPILRLAVLPRRGSRLARLYRSIWTADGSPLLVHCRAQAAGLQARLGADFRVELGMRYGEPGLCRAVARLRADGVERLLVFPMFPQFSASTSGSVYAAAMRAALDCSARLPPASRRRLPAVRFVAPYHADPAYLAALGAVVAAAAAGWDRAPDHYVFSFHGLPRRYALAGDPYEEHCACTARRLAAALALPEGGWSVGYQSRFGPGAWSAPSTEAVLASLGRAGVRRAAVVCPGFTADCLETLDEIGRRAAAVFARAGGAELRLVPCLNAHPAWLDGMAAIVRREAGGWLPAAAGS